MFVVYPANSNKLKATDYLCRCNPSGTKSSLRRGLGGKEFVCSSGYYHTLKDKLDRYLLWLVYTVSLECVTHFHCNVTNGTVSSFNTIVSSKIILAPCFGYLSSNFAYRDYLIPL